MRKRHDGMSKLLARAGKGLSYQLPQSKGLDDCDDDDDDHSEDGEDKKDEKPFEPLCVWNSPHNGGERLGLPMTM